VLLGSSELSTIEKVQSEDSMVMGSTKELHGTDEDADDNALAIPTLPEQNHKKRTLQLSFAFSRALVTFLQRTTKIFFMDPYKAGDTLPLLCCSSAAPLDIDVAIQRARTLARNDLCHRMQRLSLQQKLSTPRLTEACALVRRELRKGMYHARYRPQLSPS
jgi:hypothetical protein